MEPMLATAVETLPVGPEWVHEVKWDGMRILADVAGGRIRLSARSGAEATNRFPELNPLRDVVDDALFDGEVVSMQAGRPSFAALTRRIHVGDASAAVRLAAAAPVTYMIFDLLRLCGSDLRDQPWQHRRALLESLPWPDGRVLVVPPTYPDGAALLQATAEQDLEGVVSKRATSRYHAGRRSPDWRKHAHRPTASVVIGGWRPETGTRARLGALLVGEPLPDGGLRFLGRVGSGMNGSLQQELLPRLRDLTAQDHPFCTPVPELDARQAHWVRPELIIDVRSLGRAGNGRLRQPSIAGMRFDLTVEMLEPADGLHPGGTDAR